MIDPTYVRCLNHNQCLLLAESYKKEADLQKMYEERNRRLKEGVTESTPSAADHPQSSYRPTIIHLKGNGVEKRVEVPFQVEEVTMRPMVSDRKTLSSSASSPVLGGVSSAGSSELNMNLYSPLLIQMMKQFQQQQQQMFQALPPNLPTYTHPVHAFPTQYINPAAVAAVAQTGGYVPQAYPSFAQSYQPQYNNYPPQFQPQYSQPQPQFHSLSSSASSSTLGLAPHQQRTLQSSASVSSFRPSAPSTGRPSVRPVSARTH
jgi:hypothetical protein